ncbi:MAG: hypothetical protein KAI17_03130 [Thiotrichaceae bacterium]|nr:hypothetical protein [Thiotrichaceae bacterium]
MRFPFGLTPSIIGSKSRASKERRFLRQLEAFVIPVIQILQAGFIF